MKIFIYLLISINLLLFTACTGKQDTSLNQNYEATIDDAIRANNIEKVKSFVEDGASLEKKDKFGYTPLHLASRFNYYDIVKFLLSKDASVNTSDKFGDSPLIDATRSGYTKISKLLICNGANRTIQDKQKMTPLDYALKMNDMKTAKLLKAKNVEDACLGKKTSKQKDKEFYPLISMDNYDVIEDSKPKICGDIIDSSVTQVQISFDNGQSVIEGYIDGNRWCAKPEIKIPNGEYTVMAMAINTSKQMGKAQDRLKILNKNVLYEALKNEFDKDLVKWDAKISEEPLIVRFKNPSLLFKRGSSKISEKYKDILNDFFPRYMKILEEYPNKVSKVYIEGHSSSRFRTAKTKEEKFEKNRKLSQKRADEILAFVKKIASSKNSIDKEFIKDRFISKGMSSSKTIFNEDGSENYELSRRVEFRIETK